jgi:L-lactate dehydrogenase complex protein LldG
VEGAAARMSGRDTMLASIRRALGVNGAEAPRRAAVAERLHAHPRGLIPERGQRPAREQVALFCDMIAAASATTETVDSADAVPGVIAALLRSHNLPMALRHGADPRLAALPWARAGALTVSTGPSDGTDLVALSHAYAGVAESGTLVLTSGENNPTTLNFLPDNHFVVVAAKDIVGDYESVWRKLRDEYGKGAMPRTVNLITGPSRSADIEQTLLLGAHGPRRLHIVVVRQG